MLLRNTQVGLGESSSDDEAAEEIVEFESVDTDLPLDLCELARRKSVWERVVGLLDAPAVRALGQTCGAMYGALLRLPWSRYVGEDGEAVFVPIMRHADQNAYADHCHGLLRRLVGLYNKKGELKKKRGGYTIESRGLQRQASVAAEDSMLTVHQTLHFYNQAQLTRKMEELKYELEKQGRDANDAGIATQVDSPAAASSRRAPKRKASNAAKSGDAAMAAATAAEAEMVASDMSIKQLQEALKRQHVVPPPGTKKAGLVKMLEQARADGAVDGGAAGGGLAAMAASAGKGASAGAAGGRGARGKAKATAKTAKQAQPRKRAKSSAAAAPKGKGSKKQAAAAAAAEEEEEEEEGDPTAEACAMAAKAIALLDFNGAFCGQFLTVFGRCSSI